MCSGSQLLQSMSSPRRRCTRGGEGGWSGASVRRPTLRPPTELSVSSIWLSALSWLKPVTSRMHGVIHQLGELHDGEDGIELQILHRESQIEVLLQMDDEFD